ncbi:hypothetical protein PITCH_A1580033 [uncultured Desulfobacterium sp.]|uniref:Uncharacterized protein n=1 Tax=uncultured Desulfobacterium sp. TaxID=201089 RepID=A0A445MTU1_9BACT|nr:hypothetical protein PITCH_A1580033 [uncultured Desulfobacterium sp.]
MNENHIHFLPVVDDGGLVNITSDGNLKMLQLLQIICYFMFRALESRIRARDYYNFS